MILYIKAPLGPDGIVEMRGKMEVVEELTSATHLVYGDATFLQGKAYDGWPDIDWQIEEIDGERYIIKGNGSKQK